MLPLGKSGSMDFVVPLDTLAERAWYAYHALPRDFRGNPPSYRSLEQEHGLPQATFAKLFGGHKKSVGSANLPRLCRALGVNVAWLTESVGDPPELTGPIQPLRFDASAWTAASAPASGIAASSDPYPRRTAAADIAREDGVSEEAVLSVLKEPVAERDADRSRLWWALRMRRRQLELDDAPFEQPRSRIVGPAESVAVAAPDRTLKRR